MRGHMKIILKEIAVVLVSLYLTFLVDMYTLNTTLKYIFVFAYFILISNVIIYLKEKFLSVSNISFKTKIICLLLSLGVVIGGQSYFFPKVQETTISLTALPCSDGIYREVWFTSLKVDGEERQISQLQIDSNTGWNLESAYDDFVFYPMESSNEENHLTFNLVGQEIDLGFANNAWSGTVNIDVNSSFTEVISLTGSEGTDESISYTFSNARAYQWWEYLLYGAGATALLYFVIAVLIAVFRKYCKEIVSNKRLALIGVSGVNALLLFLSSEKIAPTKPTLIFLFLFTIAAIVFITSQKGLKYLSKYFTKPAWIAVILISLYGSLASFAQRFFLDGNTRIHFSVSGMLYCISGWLWFIPIIWFLLLCLEMAASYIKTPQVREKQERRKAKWMLFGVLAIVQLIVLMILWPGGFPNDTIDQINQAVGVSKLDDWHPVLDTLFLKLILSVVPVPGVLTLVRMFLLTWLLTAFLMIAYDSGVSVRPLICVGIIIELLPNQALSWSSVIKDIPFTLALLWGVYLLAQLAMKSSYSKKWSFYICFSFDLFLIAGLRHNGIVAFFAMLILLIILSLRRFGLQKMRILFSVFLAVFCFILYKGPLFKVLDVRPNTASPYTTMLCAAASCVNKGLPLSEESNQILEKVIPLEDWAEYYSRYYGHDQYLWGRPEGSVPYDTTDVSMKDAFTVYFDALCRYPDVVIKDRLDGMDLMWDVVQPYDSFNIKVWDHIDPYDPSVISFPLDHMKSLDNGGLQKDTVLANLYYSTMQTPTNAVSDMLLWRTGAYLIFFLVLILFWKKNNMMKLLWIATPIVGNIAASILVLYHQSFRYVYFIQLGVLVLLLLTVVLKKNCEKKDDQI